jgi:hypothetical protein
MDTFSHKFEDKVDAVTNKHLQKAFEKTDWAKGLEDRKSASRISRHLRLLREHGAFLNGRHRLKRINQHFLKSHFIVLNSRCL